jgi:hypothetical protein
MRAPPRNTQEELALIQSPYKISRIRLCSTSNIADKHSSHPPQTDEPKNLSRTIQSWHVLVLYQYNISFQIIECKSPRKNLKVVQASYSDLERKYHHFPEQEVRSDAVRTPHLAGSWLILQHYDRGKCLDDLM